jgi:hypothetical protein
VGVALFRSALCLSLVTCGEAHPPPPLGPPSSATPALSASGAPSAPVSCKDVSAEIARLVTADQTDRKRTPTYAEWPRVRAADLERRTRISTLVAAGCLSTAADYGSAALIFQHGDAPEDYLQARSLAERAVALGDPSKKDLVALAVDRYLVSTTHKQLFGSQSFRLGDDPCWCLHQVESTFPDDHRVDYVGRTLEQQRDRVRAMNSSTSGCTKVECDKELLPTPKGSVPGVW